MINIKIALLILLLLQIKHWYIDFVNQSMEEVKSKGIYGDWPGIWHSGKHGLATAVIFSLFVSAPVAFAIGVLDFATHYHTDWTKMNYGNRDITTPQFWNHLGLDQMAHQSVYIILIGLIVWK